MLIHFNILFIVLFVMFIQTPISAVHPGFLQLNPAYTPKLVTHKATGKRCLRIKESNSAKTEDVPLAYASSYFVVMVSDKSGYQLHPSALPEDLQSYLKEHQEQKNVGVIALTGVSGNPFKEFTNLFDEIDEDTKE